MYLCIPSIILIISRSEFYILSNGTSNNVQLVPLETRVMYINAYSEIKKYEEISHV